MKNQTTNNQPTTKERLSHLMQQRNDLIKWLNYDLADLEQCGDFNEINHEIITTLSRVATYKTLMFLVSNNATTDTDTSTDTATQRTTDTHGYNLATSLLKTLYHDTQLIDHNDTSDILTDCADLIQEASLALIPYFKNNVVFSLNDTIYTRVLKNGCEKSYNAFSLACKSIRDYISSHDKRQFKKLFYLVGYTENGTAILTTKKPIDTLEDINPQAYFKKCRLTMAQQEVLFYYIQWTQGTKGKKRRYTIQEIAKILNISVDSVKDRLNLALNKIKA